VQVGLDSSPAREFIAPFSCSLHVRSYYYKLERKAFKLGTSPFNYHPLSMFPSPPSPLQKRWFLSYAYNFLNVNGNLPDKDTRRQCQCPNIIGVLFLLCVLLMLLVPISATAHPGQVPENCGLFFLLPR